MTEVIANDLRRTKEIIRPLIHLVSELVESPVPHERFQGNRLRKQLQPFLCRPGTILLPNVNGDYIRLMTVINLGRFPGADNYPMQSWSWRAAIEMDFPTPEPVDHQIAVEEHQSGLLLLAIIQRHTPKSPDIWDELRLRPLVSTNGTNGNGQH